MSFQKIMFRMYEEKCNGGCTVIYCMSFRTILARVSHLECGQKWLFVCTVCTKWTTFSKICKVPDQLYIHTVYHDVCCILRKAHKIRWP